MKRLLQMSLLLGIMAFFIAPAQTYAYSYGDANAEDIAETFKLVAASLSETSPDWTAANEAYKVRKAEITSHFGQAVTDTLDHNFASKDVNLTIANYKAVLVMNLERRFSNAKEGIKDYTAAKVLLAKARATFDTLEPYMTSKISESKVAFEDALDALGNPGLFGVGKKDAQPKVFAEKVDGIYNSIKPMFAYKAYIKPAATAKPTVKPTATPVKTPVPTATPEAEASIVPSSTPTPTPVPVESAAPAEATLEPSIAPSAEAPVTTEQPEEATEIADATQEEHAPMAQTDKTNSVITIALIAGVLIVGGGAVWFARKKGLF